MRKLAAFVALTALIAFPVVAAAHATLESSDPEVDATVDEAPTEVRLTMAEQPSAGSQVSVTDGCKKKVSGKVRLSGRDMTVPISGGEPGRWNVEYSAVSADDGHEISDTYSFVVAGRKDCSAQPEETPDEVEPSIGDGGEPIENEDEGSSFPVVPLAIGTVVLVGGAFLLRRGASGS